MALHLVTFSRMDSTEAVQTKGLGFSLFTSRYSSMAAMRSLTLWKTPRLIRFSVISLNQRSTRLSQEELVGDRKSVV